MGNNYPNKVLSLWDGGKDGWLWMENFWVDGWENFHEDMCMKKMFLIYDERVIERMI